MAESSAQARAPARPRKSDAVRWQRGESNDERAVEAQERRPFGRRRGASERREILSRYLRLGDAVEEWKEDGDELIGRELGRSLFLDLHEIRGIAVAARLAVVISARLRGHLFLTGRTLTSWSRSVAVPGSLFRRVLGERAVGVVR